MNEKEGKTVMKDKLSFESGFQDVNRIRTKKLELSKQQG